MKGLLLKEYYVMRRYGKTYLLFFLFFGGSAIFTGSVAMFGAMAVVFMSSIPLSSFTLDEACKWDQLAVSTPVSRKTIVGSKYLLFAIMTGMALLICTGIVLLSMLVRPDVMSLSMGMSSVFATVGTMGIMMMLLMPIVIKLGAEKGRIAMLTIFGATFAAIMVLGLVAERSGLAGNTTEAVKTGVMVGALGVLPLLLVLAAAISYGVSCRIYAKQEF